MVLLIVNFRMLKNMFLSHDIFWSGEGVRSKLCIFDRRFGLFYTVSYTHLTLPTKA